MLDSQNGKKKKKTTVTQCPIYEHEKLSYGEIQSLMHDDKSIINLQTGRVVA